MVYHLTMSNHRLVYSTETGRVCPRCEQPIGQCRCKRSQAAAPAKPLPSDGIVRIRRETQGRRGKAVNVIYGLGLDDGALQELARGLKQRCGTGGTVKAGTIVIQGDHRERLRDALIQLGFTVKLSGG